MSVLLVHVESVKENVVTLRISLNDRKDLDREIYSFECFTLPAGDSMGISQIDAVFNPRLTLEDSL